MFKKRKIELLVDSWETMPLGIFQEINKIGANENIDEDTKALMVVALLSNKTLDDIEKLSLSEATKLVAQTSFLYTPIPKIKTRKNLNLNGKKYRIMGKKEEMTAAQFINFQAIYKDINNMLPEFMSIFIIPEGYNYGDDYDMDEVIDDIRNHLSVVEALSLADFFIAVYRRLWNRTLLFLEVKMKVLSIMGKKETKKVAKETEALIKQLRQHLNSIIGYRSLRQYHN